MAKKFKRRTMEEKRAEIEALLEKLNEGVSNFEYSPEVYKAILDMQALTPNYSFRNILLAKAQLPGAKFIAPLKRWNELGRKVKKGSSSIKILAPRFGKVTNDDGVEEQQMLGFITVPVFDYSQTEGTELPMDRIKLKLDGESEEAQFIIDAIQHLAQADDCSFSFGDAEGANGYYSPSLHKIVVGDSLSTNHKAKTAVHELVHSRVHRKVEMTSMIEKECVAEGAAYVICGYLGLDTSSYSFNYVHSWSNDNGEALIKYGDEIHYTAKSIIAEIEQYREDLQHEENIKVA